MSVNRILALIPARGGSKGIPRKNLRLLHGDPLIAHSIRTAKSCSQLSRIVVSTDDPEISRVALQYGADVPFLRPPELSTDSAKSVDVAIHALNMVELEQKTEYDAVCLLEPTSPLRTPADVAAALDLLSTSQADAVVSVYRIESPHPIKTLKIDNDRLVPFIADRWKPNLTRQELPSVFAVNGAVYCIRRDPLIAHRSFWGTNAAPYVMPEERSVNIDNEFDLALAEFLLQQRSATA
jgi:CMP-N,N'-diacetyllegionaminic acid synthase